MEDFKKKLYISETDERMLHIQQKSGSAGMPIVLYCLALGATAAGSINGTVFFTLMGAAMLVALTFGGLKLYYRIKY